MSSNGSAARGEPGETSGSAVSVDLLIIGAGPVGLFGAYYAGARGLSTALLDSLPEPGGQITAMYPEKAIFDVAGFPAIRGRELVAALVAQAAPFGPNYLLGQQATVLERGGDFSVLTSTGTRVSARAVIVTGGIGTFTPRPLPVGEEYLGRGVVHFVPDPDSYRGLDIVVVGGGDSALDWALMLEPLAASVTVVHRRNAFRAHPHSVQLAQRSRVRLITDAQVAKVLADPAVTAVEVAVKGEAQPVVVPCTRVVAALGFTANLGPLLEWGLNIKARRHIPVDTRMSTSVPGIYAAGDIADYEGKIRLIATGFGEVATAVNNAANWLDPSVSAFPGHLSDYGPPTAGEPVTVAAAVTPGVA